MFGSRAKKADASAGKQDVLSAAATQSGAAVWFRTAKFVSLLIFLALVLFGLALFNTKETADTFHYLIKNLSGSEIVYGSSHAPIAFNTDSSVKCAAFRGDIIIATKSGVDLYDTQGELILTDQYAFSSPELLVGDANFLVYDVGGHTLRVYNAFSNVFTTTLPYQIFAVSLHDNGTFAVATSEKGYHAAVYVYNASFQLIYKWLSPDKLVFDVSLCPYDSARLLVATCKASEGNFSGEIISLSTQSEDIVSSVHLDNALPMQVSYVKKDANAHFWVLTDTYLANISSDNQVLAKNTFTSTDLSAYHIGPTYGVLAQKKSMVGTTYELKIFAPGEKEQFCTDVGSQIFDIVSVGKKVYVLAYETLYILEPASKTVHTYSVSRSFRKILPLENNTLAFVSDNTVCFLLME